MFKIIEERSSISLPNLPLSFWHHKVLEDIRNNLGSFKKAENEIIQQGLFTFTRICYGEIHLSKGLSTLFY